MSSAVEGLQLDRRGPVIEATLSRGSDNLLSMPMCRALIELLVEPPEDAHVLHLRGAGGVFCLGRDRAARSIEDLRAEAETLVALNTALSAGQLITVAELAGHAAGFGVGLAALCDISVAAPSVRLRFPEVEAGLCPSVVLAWLPRLIGRSQAFRLTATGVAVCGAEAVRLGLITRVADSDQELASTVAEEIAAVLRHPLGTHREIRTFLRETAGADEALVAALAVDRLMLGSMRMPEGS